MIRYKDQIRLTPKERAAFVAATGISSPPTTVAEHDAALEQAAQVWECGDSAEEKLAALLARNMNVERDPTPPVASGTI